MADEKNGSKKKQNGNKGTEGKAVAPDAAPAPPATPPSAPAAGNGDEGKNSLLYIIIAVLAVVVLVMFLNSRKPAEPTSTPSPTGTALTTEECEACTAVLAWVKEAKGQRSGVPMEERLGYYETKIETDKKVQVEPGDWFAKPLRDPENRYYTVTYTWKENGTQTMFEWLADNKDKTLQAKNDAASEFEKFDESIPPVAAITPEVTGTPVPGATPAVTPSGIAMTPITPGSPSPGATGDINILPPTTPVQSPPPVPSSPISVPPPPVSGPTSIPTPPDTGALTPPPVDEPSYSVTGIISSGGTRIAMLQGEGGKAHSVSAGARLPDGWVVSSVTDNTVVLRKGTNSRTLRLRQGAPAAPPAVTTPKSGSYPKATPRKGSKATRPPVDTGAPGGEPTLIPIE